MTNSIGMFHLLHRDLLSGCPVEKNTVRESTIQEEKEPLSENSAETGKEQMAIAAASVDDGASQNEVIIESLEEEIEKKVLRELHSTEDDMM